MYQKAKLDLTYFETDDIITTSTGITATVGDFGDGENL